ncbi:sce7726 family protein [Metabacillus sp. 22489]|uniref:sce7726 family protein n=1 Tax=Metabacillus sp. 22489 TaxID=3453928 RepID=UPI003F856754
MNRLRDNDLRNALLKDLYSRYSKDKGTKIVNEMGVIHGQSRVDVAVINGILHGYEIKSESDNLLRLPSQITDYSKVFDRMTIVVQRKHLEEVRAMIPKWWGIILVTKSKDNINLRELRKGRENSSVDPLALSRLLWREEALEILKQRSLHKGLLSKPRNVLYNKLCDSVSLNELKIMVNQRLKKRVGWRDQEKQALSDDLLLQ